MSSSAVVHQPSELVSTDDGFSLRLERRPKAIIEEAKIAADALMQAVRDKNWVQRYGSKEHLFFEAWSFLASMYRVCPRVRETRIIQVGDVTGFEAFAEAFHIPSGIVISTADAMCLDDEDNWDLRPKYEWRLPPGGSKKERTKVSDEKVPLFQLRSMAQTRAMSKALRAPFSWIVAMAGYAPTAAEDGPGMEPEESAPPRGPQNPQQKPMNDPGRRISEPQGKRIWALAKAANKSNDEVAKIMQYFGYQRTEDITVQHYEAICAEVQRGDAQ